VYQACFPVSIEDYNLAVDQHADGIYRFAVKHLRDNDLAKDVVQESFARLWMRVDAVDGAKAKSYLFTTAHHLLVDEVRHAGRSSRMEDRHADLHYGTQAPPDLKATLDAALATLPQVQRSVVLLRDLEGYSYEEIAELTGLNLPQVKVYIYRGRTALKEWIGSLENVL
jgi:RNA polymerase sigma factor (sigma-70 family)